MPTLIDFILHIDVHLQTMTAEYGIWIYAILFAIIFCETGLVVMPFLPGDSLLFAAGAMAAIGALDPFATAGLIIVAAFLGDNCNYWLGRTLGPKVFSDKNSRFIKYEYLIKTQRFYDKHGSKAVIMARFVPIVRTFAPFVAGIGQMPYPRFLAFSTIGSVLWVSVCIGAGFFLGNIPVVKQNFSLVVLAIIGISVLPIIISVIKEAKMSKAEVI